MCPVAMYTGKYDLYALNRLANASKGKFLTMGIAKNRAYCQGQGSHKIELRSEISSMVLVEDKMF